MVSARRGAVHQHSVLVVEDSEVTREALVILFELEGHRVGAVANGAEALHVLRAESLRPCIIVVDLVMPTMDGLAFGAEQLRNPDLAGIPLIALTGHDGLRRRALEMGFAAGLMKPCDFGELFRLIDQHCKQTAARVQTQPA